MSKLFFASILFLLLLNGCFVMENKYTALPPGKWRAVLKIQPEFITPNPKGRPLPDKVNMKYDDVKEGELPFTLEVTYDNDTTFYIDILNGEERIRVPAQDIRFGRGKERARDTIRIEFPIFDSYISGAFAGNVIEGSWVVKNRDNYAIPFVATQGKDYRFTAVRKPPVLDLSGKWQATFGLTEGEDPYPAVGEFKQEGNRLTGTFLTETGDYRFLEGTVQGDQFWLSCFDGSHAFLFEGKILPDSSLIGAYFSGKHYRTTWEARRNENATLAPADSLTFLKPGFDKLTFAFQNPDGKVISPENEAYKGKVKIIQLLGTWCPNCRDETEFLLDYLAKNAHPDLAVIALAFEKYSDKEKANQAIRTYKKRFGMTYELVHAGSYKKDEAAKALPMLDRVLAFPTLIFLDKNNRVRKIHTGFTGPATSQYTAFKKDFEEFVAGLLAESS
jgi:thiol-disulfide isomerase/thioredoxin